MITQFFLILFLITFKSLCLFAENATNTSILPEATKEVPQFKKTNYGMLALTTSLKSTRSVNPDFPVVFTNDSYVSFGLGLFAIREESRRAFFTIGYEKFGEIADISNTNNLFKLSHLYLQISYDHILVPTLTDIFLNLSGTYIPAQGNPLIINNISYAPRPGLGFEVGVGWNSPFNVSFLLGLRSQFRQFSFYKSPQIPGQSDLDNVNAGYGGIFLTTCLGRF